eukprot:15458599-Alexandrium_andersonii.AAC.1
MAPSSSARPMSCGRGGPASGGRRDQGWCRWTRPGERRPTWAEPSPTPCLSTGCLLLSQPGVCQRQSQFVITVAL